MPLKKKNHLGLLLIMQDFLISRSVFQRDRVSLPVQNDMNKLELFQFLLLHNALKIVDQRNVTSKNLYL